MPPAPDSDRTFRPVLASIGRKALSHRRPVPMGAILSGQPSIADGSVSAQPRPFEVAPRHDEQLETLIVEPGGGLDELGCYSIIGENHQVPVRNVRGSPVGARSEQPEFRNGWECVNEVVEEAAKILRKGELLKAHGASRSWTPSRRWRRSWEPQFTRFKKSCTSSMAVLNPASVVIFSPW